MKKYLLLVNLILLLCAAIQAQVPNKQFKNWSADTVSVSPTDWFSTNGLILSDDGKTPVSRATDATDGKFSVVLETKDGFPDKIEGIISNVPADQLPSFPFVRGGWAFKAKPDSIYLDAKYDIKAGDSAVIAIMFKLNSSPIGINIFRIGGQQNTWKSMGFDIADLFLAPDTVIILIASSDPQNRGNAKAGSTLSLDNIRFAGGSNLSTLPNTSFENWDASVYEYPNGWSTFDRVYSVHGVKTTQMNDTGFLDSAALQLTNKEMPKELQGQFEKALGFAVTSKFLNLDFVSLGDFDGFGISGAENKLMGYYKFSSPDANDSASVGLWLKKNSVVIDSFVMRLPRVNTLTQFVLPFKASASPDSAIVALAAGIIKNDPNMDLGELFVPNASLIVDDIHVNDWPLFVGAKAKLQEARLFPNPAKDNVKLQLNSAYDEVIDLTLYDVQGRMVKSFEAIKLRSNIESDYILSLDGLLPGSYLLKLVGSQSSQTLSLIVK